MTYEPLYGKIIETILRLFSAMESKQGVRVYCDAILKSKI